MSALLERCPPYSGARFERVDCITHVHSIVMLINLCFETVVNFLLPKKTL